MLMMNILANLFLNLKSLSNSKAAQKKRKKKFQMTMMITRKTVQPKKWMLTALETKRRIKTKAK